VAALLLLVPSLAHSTVLVPAGLSELSRDAAAIVRGTVVSVHAEWAEGRRRVETIVTLGVEETLKGGLGDSVVFKVPGGDMGRYRSVMIGTPTFREGEEVIIFLGARPPALPYLLGLGQGVYRIARDNRTGVARVISPVLLSSGGGTVTVQRGDPARRAPTIQEFAAEVRDAVARADGRRDPASRGRRIER
jgi:hypothetical protein